VAITIVIKESIWDKEIKDGYIRDTIAMELLNNPREDFIIKEGFLLFRGRIYVLNRLRRELLKKEYKLLAYRH
jgi:hypothetical protein